ncbi:Cytochrome P450 [Rhypophila decipiens]
MSPKLPDKFVHYDQSSHSCHNALRVVHPPWHDPYFDVYRSVTVDRPPLQRSNPLLTKYNLPDAELSSLTGNLFGAGADTSSSTLVTFVLACVAFPDAMRKAQEELDRVIGPGRSPHWDDAPNLPYINAFVKEV